MILSRDYFEKKALVFLMVFFVVVILCAGIFSDIYLGDESFHYRLATYVYKAHAARPLFDPLALTNPVGKSYYVDPMLWHTGLSLIWRVFGGIGHAFAQIYQVLWYILLVGSTYAFGKAVRDKKTGFWAALLVATMPISTALSTILHTDIPVAAVSTLAVFLTVTRRFFLAGVVYALATYVKRNSYLLLPGLLLIIILTPFLGISDERTRERSLLKSLTVFILPLCILILPEVFYRYATFGIQSFWSGNIRRPDTTFRSLQIEMPPWQGHYLDISLRWRDMCLDEKALRHNAPVVRVTDIAYGFRQKRQQEDTDLDRVSPLLVKDDIISQVTSNFTYEGEKQQPFVFYDESNLLMNPLIFIKYFGIVICIAVVLYLARRLFEKKDILLLLPLAAYLPMYIYLFRLGLNARYLAPLIGIVSVLGGVSCASLSRRSLRGLVVSLCVLQFMAASLVTFYFRRIPAGIKHAYTVIKDDLPENVRVMCCMNALSLYTGRYSIWLGVPALHELGFLFFTADEGQMRNIFDKYDIGYILVEKNRIYDDSHSRHTGGYPQSFVKKLKASVLCELLLENKDVLLFRIKERLIDK